MVVGSYSQQVDAGRPRSRHVGGQLTSSGGVGTAKGRSPVFAQREACIAARSCPLCAFHLGTTLRAGAAGEAAVAAGAAAPGLAPFLRSGGSGGGAPKLPPPFSSNAR